MRLVFAGTPEFAAVALAQLVEAGHEVALVLTQPDRPAGRGLQPVASAVKRLALKHDIDVYQPDRLRPDDIERVRNARPEALVVAAYGLLLPQALLDAAPLGAWNIHASLLPRWRGAAPIQRALIAGDSRTGISIMKMDAGLDTGPVLAQGTIEIGAEEDAGSLHDRLAQLGARMMADALRQIEAGVVPLAAQSASGATYAPKIDKRESILDWQRTATELDRAIRAFRPVPGAATVLEGESLKLWRARVTDGHGVPGEVLHAESRLVVACGERALEVLELQRAGGKRLDAGQFLRGRPLARGARFG